MSMRYRRAAALVFFLVLALPSAAVIAMDAASWPAGQARRALAVLGVGLGGWAALFVLLVIALPGILKRSERVGLALHWRCAAFHASLWSSGLTVIWTLSKVPAGSPGVRAVASVLAAGAAFAPFSWAKRRYFDGPCGELGGWPR